MITFCDFMSVSLLVLGLGGFRAFMGGCFVFGACFMFVLGIGLLLNGLFCRDFEMGFVV